MGYFSNGSEGEAYEAKWCSRCRHRDGIDGHGCPVWLAHLLYNYDECNKPSSILHLLIPRKKEECANDQCMMFVQGDNPTRADLEYLLNQAIERERAGEVILREPKP